MLGLTLPNDAAEGIRIDAPGGVSAAAVTTLINTYVTTPANAAAIQALGAATLGLDQIITFAITAARLGTLGSVPLALVAAPGANLTIDPLEISIAVTQSGAYGSAPTWRFRFAGYAADYLTPTTTDLNNNRNKLLRLSHLASYELGANVTSVNNAAFQLSMSADPVAGGVATAFVTFKYRIFACPP